MLGRVYVIWRAFVPLTIVTGSTFKPVHWLIQLSEPQPDSA